MERVFNKFDESSQGTVFRDVVGCKTPWVLRRHGRITARTGTTPLSVLYDVRYREDDVHNVGFNFIR